MIAAQPAYAGKTIDNSIVKDYLDDVEIIRIKLPDVDKNSIRSRLKYIATYFFSALKLIIHQKNVDIIYTISQPPILGGAIGTIGKLIKQAKHVYNVQDFNPEQALAANFINSKFLYTVAKFVDKVNCKISDYVVLVGHDMAETLIRRFKGKHVPMHTVINNWTDEDEIIPLKKQDTNVQKFLIEHGLEDKFVVMYSGNLGLYYDLENIIKLTKKFKAYPNIKFVFIGEGAVKEKMTKYVEAQAIDNVVFLTYQPKKDLKYSLNAADIHLVVNQKGIKGVSVPSKIYGVMAAGKSVLGILEKGSEAEQLISKSRCGLVTEPGDYNEIENAIIELYEKNTKDLIEMGNRGRAYLDMNLKKEMSLEKYKVLLKSL